MTFTLLTADEFFHTDTDFPFAFSTVSNEVIGADSRTGICEGIIDGYESLEPTAEDDEPWTTARFKFLADAAGAAQVALVDAAFEAHPGLAESLTEDEMTALFHPKDEEVLSFEAWPRDELPLILLADGYAGYTDVPRPAGDGIIWVDAHDERLFLDSLKRLGYGDLLVKEQSLEELDIDF